MTTSEGESINKTAEATSKASDEPSKHLQLQSAPTVHLTRFIDRQQKFCDLTNSCIEEVYVRHNCLTGDGLTDNLRGSVREEYLCAPNDIKQNYSKLLSL